MKNFLFIMIFLIPIEVLAQNITEINSDFKLSDSLTFDIEIRIYQGGGITNYSSLFRMFKDNSGKWTAEFHEHYAKVDGEVDLQTKKRILRSENEMEFVFQNLLRSHILHLPSLSEIQWKLVIRGNVEKVKKRHGGMDFYEYTYMNNVVMMSDGKGYIVQAKVQNRYNDFEFYNPDLYLKYFPNIDEIIYMCEILNTIRNEFSIMED